MKAELRFVPHEVIHGQQVVEVWFDGKLVAAIYGADGPGVRVVSRFPMSVEVVNDALKVVEVRIDR